MRTFLTLLGIFIGIAAVVGLISLGQGLQHVIDEQFQLMGVDKIMIIPGQSTIDITAGGNVDLTDSDLDIIRKVRGVKLATGWVYKITSVKFRDEVQYTWVTGISLDEDKAILDSMENFEVEFGRDLQKGDRYSAVVGVRFPDADLFEKPVGLRDKVEINGQDFKVVGIISEIGNPQDDANILIPIDVSREVLSEPEKYGVLIAQSKEGEDVSRVASDIKRKLRKFRDVEEGEEDFTVQTSEQLIESFETIFLIVQAVLIGIAAISLFVGGIGIMNTMYTSVVQRTPEIGVMKAIGARNSSIMTIFLIESGILGLAGGIIGIILGVAMSKVVEIVAAQAGMSMLKAYFPWYLIVGALVFSVLVGMLSGILPARQAAKMHPVDALRYSE